MRARRRQEAAEGSSPPPPSYLGSSSCRAMPVITPATRAMMLLAAVQQGKGNGAPHQQGQHTFVRRERQHAVVVCTCVTQQAAAVAGFPPTQTHMPIATGLRAPPSWQARPMSAPSGSARPDTAVHPMALALEPVAKKMGTPRAMPCW